MSIDHPATATDSATAELRRAYEHAVSGTSVRDHYVRHRTGAWVHVLERGRGTPVVVLHGTGSPAGFMLPLLEALDGVRVLAPDLPGVGLSDPAVLPRASYREAAVGWLDGLLDALELDRTALVGHSGGGVWALSYALARPDRVSRLVLMGPPTLPGTRCPLPIRVIATPGLGALLARLDRPSRASVLRIAKAVGEQDTLPAYPDLVDLLVAANGHPSTQRAARAEFRALCSPVGLLTATGFRPSARISVEDLRALAVETLVIWGKREPLGSVAVAQATTESIPRARLTVLPTGHGPWLGEPHRTAEAVLQFVR